MKTRTATIWLACLAAIAFAAPARAWLRFPCEDAIVVERSELIVVARMKEGSIEYAPHNKKPGEGGSHEHHARLIITEVLKGATADKEIPIIIHYGLTPLVGGYAKRGGGSMNRRAGNPNYPPDIIEVIDTGNSQWSMYSLVKDAREDNIWFLRKRSGTHGEKPGTGDYGIVDPEDLRPIELKSYLMAYLSDKPEMAIRRHQRVMAQTQERAQRYLDHRAVQRVLRMEDVQKRLAYLKPLYLRRQFWNVKREARDGIVACGAAAAPLLMDMFDDPDCARQRADIILLFRDIDCRAAAPKLVRLLQSHVEYWRNTPILKGQYRHGQNREDEQTRRQTHSEIYRALCALQTLGDESAVNVVRETKRQWLQDGFKSEQIVEECDKFLKKFAPEKG